LWYELKIPVRFVTVLLIMLLVSCGCSGDKKDKSDSGKIYFYPCSERIKTLDPALATSQNEDSIIGEIFDTLVTIDSNFQVVPELAESWEYDSEKAVYTFHLKKGVKFHNGIQMKAGDVLFSFTRLADPKLDSPWSDSMMWVKGAGDYNQKKSSEISGIRIVDDYTIEIELKRIYTPFLNLLASNAFSILPEELYATEEYGSDHLPVGCGPFKYQGKLDDGSIQLVANKDYHSGPPLLDGIVFRFIEDHKEMISEYKKGNLHHIWVFPDLAEKILSDESIPGMIESYPMNAIYFYAFNLERRQFGGSAEPKRLLRQALNYAVDREMICKDVFQGRCIPTKSALSDGILDYSNPMMDRLGFNFDRDKALELLEAAGYPNGNGVGMVSLYTTYESPNIEIAEIVKNNLSEIGLEVEIVAKDKENYLKAVREGDSALFSYIWYMRFPDIDDFAGMFYSANAKEGGVNLARMTRENIDGLVDLARRESDTDVRKGIYMELDSQLVFDTPWLFMFKLKNTILVQSDVKGFREQLCQLDYNEALSHVRMEKVDLIPKAEK
jgi:oligopeptide transport system substrate-binding protein